MRLYMACFCLGIMVTSILPILPNPYLSWLFMTLPIWMLCLSRLPLRKAMLVPLISITVLLSGIGYSSFIGQQRLYENNEPFLLNKEVSVQGVIVGFPQKRKSVWTFTLDHVSVDGLPLRGRIRLSWYSYQALKPSQCWHVLARLKKPYGLVSPGAFDAEAWLRRERVAYTGYVVNDRGNHCLGSVSSWGLDAWRYKLAAHIKNSLPNIDSSLGQALLLGNKGGISKDDWELFNQAGTTHLLVISGLHIGLIFMFGYLLLRGLKCFRLLPLHLIAFPRLAVMVGLFLGGIYALLAGFSVPVQRALIMLLCGCVGTLFDVKFNPSTVWLTALTSVLLIDPMATMSAGFWYSFIAVAALLLVFSNRSGEVSLWRRWCLPQWGVFIALLPLLSWFGQASSCWSPFINLISIPLVGLIIVPSLMVKRSLSKKVTV